MLQFHPRMVVVIMQCILKLIIFLPVKTLNSISRETPMIYMEGKKFKMGVNDPSSRTGEYPVKSVAVKPFRLDRHAVTNGDFM